MSSSNWWPVERVTSLKESSSGGGLDGGDVEVETELEGGLSEGSVTVLAPSSTYGSGLMKPNFARTSTRELVMGSERLLVALTVSSLIKFSGTP